MFSAIKKEENLVHLGKNIQDLVGFNLNRTMEQITTELVQVSNQIRENIARGQFWHTNLLSKDFSDEETKYYAALYTQIFMEEMMYCRQTIDFIQFISHKYFEEEVLDKRELEDEIEMKGNNTLPMTKQDIPHVSTKLAEDLFVGANLINRNFLDLLTKLGSPFSNQTITSKSLAEGCKITLYERFTQSIPTAISDKPSSTHGQFIGDFGQLFKIVQNCFRMMSVFAFSNLFRFMEGSIYCNNPILDAHSIFANQGRPLKFQGENPPEPMFKLDINKE